jgi:chromosome segregation ATPase
MPIEEKKKIQAWVPISIWIQVESFGFKSQNEAVNSAFEKLIEIQGNNQAESKENQINSKNNQLESNMINELRARLEEKENSFRELQNHNETLKRELNKAEQDKEDLKTTYNNYFLQVQTLINQKAIEAPGKKNKPFWKFW